jgi:hypothetical protein
LKPEVLTSTAKVRIAPMTNKKMLKPIPTSCLLDSAGLPSGLLSAGLLPL